MTFGRASAVVLELNQTSLSGKEGKYLDLSNLFA